MNGYARTTRECSISQLHPSLSQAIRDYFQAHQLGDPVSGSRMCCETISEKRKTGKLAAFLEGNPDTTIHLGILITDEWLIWAGSGDRSGTKVNGIRLKGLQVKTFVTRRTNNMQLEISGMIGGTKEYVRGILEMGSELAAQKFCAEVVRIVNQLTPPAKKSQFRWFGL
jgi:hypothetical protein